MAATKPSFNHLVVDAFVATGRTATDVWTQLKEHGWPSSKGHFYNLVRMKTKRPSAICKSGLPALKSVLLPDISDDWQEVKRTYDIRLVDYPPDDGEVTDFDAACGRIDKMYDKLNTSSTKVGAWTRQLIATLDERHILISMTSGLCPPILEWDHDMGRDKMGDEQRKYRIVALKNGLLWALITPTRTWLKKLEKQGISIDADERYVQITEGFARLEGYFAEHDVSAQMIRFESDEFPLTPYGWTTSLIGWRDARQNRCLRVIIRSAYQRSLWYQLFPSVPEFERDVFDFSMRVLNHDPDTNNDRKKFVSSIKRRMKL